MAVVPLTGRRVRLNAAWIGQTPKENCGERGKEEAWWCGSAVLEALLFAIDGKSLLEVSDGGAKFSGDEFAFGGASGNEVVGVGELLVREV